jgi:DUF917 family protein
LSLKKMTVRRVGEGQQMTWPVGAAAGGGGNPYRGALLTKQVIREHRPVERVTVNEMPDDALVVATADTGPNTGSALAIRFQNEHLVAVRNGQVVARRRI